MQQQFETDNIDELPLGEFSSNEPQNNLESLFNVAQETSSNENFRSIVISIIVTAGLFALIASSPISEMIRNQLGGEETYTVIAVRAFIFSFVYYILSNTFLNKSSE